MHVIPPGKHIYLPTFNLLIVFYYSVPSGRFSLGLPSLFVIKRLCMFPPFHEGGLPLPSSSSSGSVPFLVVNPQPFILVTRVVAVTKYQTNVS